MPTFTGTDNNDVLTGTAGDDTIDAGIGRDTLTGAAGNDSLNGGPGDDLVFGDDGADTVLDTQGANIIHGGAGNDDITAVGLIYGEDGDDTVSSTTTHLTVVAGAGNDAIRAGGELYGGAGDDSIGAPDGSFAAGEDGNDWLTGTKLVTFLGGDGNDTLGGQYGSTLVGGNGDDVISNLDGGRIDAGAGDDRVLLIGGYYLPNPRFPPFPVTPVDVDLGDGNDVAYLSSMAGGVVRGGAGDDVFYQNQSSYPPNPFTVVMDAGRDQLITKAGNLPLTVEGFTAGAGGDVLRFASFSTPFIDNIPWAPALTEQFTSDPFVGGFLRVVQSGADTLLQWNPNGGADDVWSTMTTLKDVTRGALTSENFGGWNPLALERVDAPFILGLQSNWDGNANPFLTGHLALVTEGNDTLLLMDRNGGANEMFVLARYIDTPASAITASLLGGVDPIVQPVGLATNDRVQPVDTGYPLYLFGGAGDDTLVGLGRADTLDGGSGANTIQAGGGDDVIWVHSAPDKPQLVQAGEGDDTLHFSSGAQAQLGGGSDTAILEADFAVGAPVELGFLDFQGGAGGDKLDLRTFLAAQTTWTSAAGNPFAAGYLRVVQSDVASFLQVDANGGGDSYRQLLYFSGTPAASLTADNFFGFDPLTQSNTPTAGADVLIGTAGADTLLGLAGDDSISGGAGADSISGDAGADTLAGGAGADTFRLASDSAMDWVRDFNAFEGDRVMVQGQAWVAYQYGGDVVVDVPGGRMMIQNTLLSSLPSGWIFGTDTPPVSIQGTAEDEILGGGSGADTLFGNGGRDSISGGGGNDSLSGGSDSDTVSGGAGADTFRLAGDSGMDWIQDFNASEGDRVMVAGGLSWTAYQFGADTVVDVAGGRMMLLNTQLSTLSPGWIFSG